MSWLPAKVSSSVVSLCDLPALFLVLREKAAAAAAASAKGPSGVEKDTVYVPELKEANSDLSPGLKHISVSFPLHGVKQFSLLIELEVDFKNPVMGCFFFYLGSSENSSQMSLMA